MCIHIQSLIEACINQIFMLSVVVLVLIARTIDQRQHRPPQGLASAQLRVRFGSAACRRNKSVYIPAIGGMPKVHRSWTLSEWARRVALQRKLGGDGIIIYRIAEFDTAVAAFFGKGPFYGKARFPDPIK